MTGSTASRDGAMTLTVEVQLVATDEAIPTQQQLGDWARAAWQDDGRDIGVVVRVTDEAESRQLNRDYRHIDRPTNVLSFPFDPVPGVEFDHVGDLVVCAPVVAREAPEQGKSTVGALGAHDRARHAAPAGPRPRGRASRRRKWKHWKPEF